MPTKKSSSVYFSDGTPLNRMSHDGGDICGEGDEGDTIGGAGGGVGAIDCNVGGVAGNGRTGGEAGDGSCSA